MSTYTLTESRLVDTTLTLLQGADALQTLQNAVFAEQWDCLADQCPWATVYQRKEFVLTWYETYQSVYTPIVLYTVQNGRLTGLLTLTQRKTGGNLSGAGTNQAEYQVWLAAENSDFIRDALFTIKQTFPDKQLQLKYTPAGTPLDLFRKADDFRDHCMIQEFRQPIMHLQADYLHNELRKKNRREKLNRLKRQGDLYFEKITQEEKFEAILHDLMPQYDFRKAATVNIRPFQDDPFKKEFLLRLFRKDVLHVSLLKLNDTIIASNVGAVNHGCLHLQGFNTHSPFHAKHSPGILHFLMLGQHLCADGFSEFDLTPGGDAYKEQLATHTQTVHLLTFGPPLRLFATSQKLTLSTKLKHAINRYGKSPYAWKQLKFWALNTRAKLRSGIKHGLIASLKAQLPAASYLRCYSLQPDQELPFSSQPMKLKHNDLGDLLQYCPNGFAPTPWEFLANAMKKFENGEQCFTYAIGNRLTACIWLRTSVSGAEEGVYLHQLYLTDPSIAPELLANILKDVRAIYPDTPIQLELPKHISTGNIPLANC